MEVINWSNFDGTAFQHFCNALLSFEIGKQFIPYSAPGKDQGIDGSYQGEYNEKKGKWRFQYKFHSVARKKGYDLLKADIKKEAAKINDETNFILLTNVELLPQELSELNTVLTNETLSLRRNISFEIWDGAKLFALFLKYPLLDLWMKEGFSTSQLQDYKSHFKPNLESTDEDPSTLANYFVSRIDEIQLLENYRDGKQIMALVTGEAGIGKTRMVLEFLKRTEEKSPDWQMLVLQNHAVEFDKIKAALGGERKSIILIDDAHQFNPSVVADMKSLADQLGGTVKLILTARSLEAYSSLKLIKEYEQQKILKIDLEKLSPTETLEIFKHELEGYRFEHYYRELTSISNGKPILIVALLRAIKSGTQIAKIKEDSFFSDYVNNYFETIMGVIIDETNASKLQLRKLLQFICLIEPFTYTSTAAVKLLARVCGIEPEVVSVTLNKLLETGISVGRFEQAIRPDFYSDILLLKADPVVITEHLPELIEFVEHIIINLSSVDEVRKDEHSILDLILGIYISNIDTTDGDINRITKIVTTVASIAYQKPKIASEAVTIFIQTLENKNHVIAKDIEANKHYYYQSPESITGRIKNILFDLLYFPAYYEFVFTALIQLHKYFPETKAENTVLAFSKRDHIEHFSFKRQLYITEAFHSRIKKLLDAERQFAVNCCKLFLNLDFTSSASEDPSGNTITITTFYLHETSTVKKLRSKVIILLIEIFKESEEPEVKLAAYSELLDIPRGIFATKRNPVIYEGKQEIHQVLDFLVETAADVPANIQKEILDKLFWYKKWGIDKSFEEKLFSIEELLQPKNLTQEIIHLLAKSELGFSSSMQKETLKRSKEIVEKADPYELGTSLLELIKTSQNRMHFLWPFLSVVYNEFSEKAKLVYETIWEKDPEVIYQFGAPFLQALGFKHRQKVFFWDKAQQLISTNNADADNALLRSYTFFDFKKDQITDEDIGLIRSIAQKADPHNHFDLARAVQIVLQFDEETGKTLSFALLSRCNQREADIFFVFLGEKEWPSYQTVKTLALDHSVRFSVTYEVERCLNKVVKAEGVDPIVDYFVKRFEFQKKIYASTKSILHYEWVPHADHSHLFEGCDDSLRIDFFKKGLIWYVQASFEALEHFLAKKFLEYISQTEQISEELSNHLEKLTEKYLADKPKLVRTLDCLEVFKQKDERLVEVVLRIYAKLYSVYGSDPEGFKELRYLCYSGITTMGVKSGTAGDPFQVDLDLRDLLKKYQKNLEQSDPVFIFLTEVIKVVEKDIQSESDRFNEAW